MEIRWNVIEVWINFGMTTETERETRPWRLDKRVSSNPTELFAINKLMTFPGEMMKAITCKVKNPNRNFTQAFHVRIGSVVVESHEK